MDRTEQCCIGLVLNSCRLLLIAIVGDMAVGMRWSALVCLALVFCSPAFCLRTARTDFTRCTTIRSNTCLIRGATKSMSDSERLYELLKESDVRPKYPEREEIIAMIDAGNVQWFPPKERPVLYFGRVYV